MVAMPVHRDISAYTTVSLIESQALLAGKYGLGINFQVQLGSSLINAARSKCAHKFLESDSTVLFWIDSDIYWSANDFVRMIALSTKMDVLGGAYTTKTDPPKFAIKHKAGQALVPNEYGCIPVEGLGLGFTIVNRHVIEKLSERAPKGHLPDPDLNGEPIPQIFRIEYKNGKMRGEDIGFFDDCKELGIQPWLDPSIGLGHVGTKVYAGNFDDYLKPKDS